MCNIHAILKQKPYNFATNMLKAYLTQLCPLALSVFGRMLSVGAIHFEDRFCASRKGGTGGGGWVHRSG